MRYKKIIVGHGSIQRSERKSIFVLVSGVNQDSLLDKANNLNKDWNKNCFIDIYKGISISLNVTTTVEYIF